jgi:cytochrome c-type biogenesis protein CcmH/NrfG
MADLARLLGLMGRPKEAVLLLEQAQLEDSGNISIRMMLGQNLLRDGQAQRAVEAADACLKLPGARRYAPLYTLLGQAHLAAGDDKSARRALETALQMDPKLALPHLALSQLLLRTGQQQEGEREVAAFRECRKRDELIAELNSEVAARPDDAELLLALAAAYVDRGNPDHAKRLLSRATSLAPRDPAILKLSERVERAVRGVSSAPAGN